MFILQTHGFRNGSGARLSLRWHQFMPHGKCPGTPPGTLPMARSQASSLKFEPDHFHIAADIAKKAWEPSCTDLHDIGRKLLGRSVSTYVHLARYYAFVRLVSYP